MLVTENCNACRQKKKSPSFPEFFVHSSISEDDLFSNKTKGSTNEIEEIQYSRESRIDRYLKIVFYIKHMPNSLNISLTVT